MTVSAKLVLVNEKNNSSSSANLADSCVSLRYHGRWIFTKNAKNLFLAVQIEKTEINILQNEWGKGLFYFLS